MNVWHWAHRVGGDCDYWAERLTNWHRAYQCVVPVERCEVVMGEHRADVVTADGHVVELQHSTISAEDITARERHYGPRMYWLFDARAAYAKERLLVRSDRTKDYVTFRWKQPRRSILACELPVMLDLGEGLVLRIEKFYPDGPPYGGWGHLFETQDIWRWMRDGTVPQRQRADCRGHQQLTDRIVRTVEYIRSHGEDLSGSLDTTDVALASLFDGNSPRQELRAAMLACGPQVPEALRAYHLYAHWGEMHGDPIPVVELPRCVCGSPHWILWGPRQEPELWNEWVQENPWPRPLVFTCEVVGRRVPAIVHTAPHFLGWVGDGSITTFSRPREDG